jgi:extracellular factor (EF) 3-hydroxypalmitic acid methyl ester biosynthesis protein
MEVYNPYSIVQVSEVLSELTVRFGANIAYLGKAVVISLVNTGLTAIVSLTLIDEWRELNDVVIVPGAVRVEAQAFVHEWTKRFQIRRDYQIVVNEMRAYLSDVSRWVEQVDLSESLPKEDGRLREDVFNELFDPLMQKMTGYIDTLNTESYLIDDELLSAHRSFAQTALHPLLLQGTICVPHVYKTVGIRGRLSDGQPDTG